jgi:threonine dehydratase
LPISDHLNSSNSLDNHLRFPWFLLPEIPSNPCQNKAVNPSLTTIHQAQKLLAGYFPPTRLIEAPSLSRRTWQVFLKLETDLPTASFKPRGALYALATHLKRRSITEVIASSTGNHGAAVAWAAKTLGVPATIFLPANPNAVKRQRIADLGARIVESGGQDLTHAFLEAQQHATGRNVYFLNDATDPDLPAGPATIGVEILSQLPEAATLYVPMGDTALIRGIGAATRQLNPKVKIIGVQAERAPCYYLSWKAGRPVPTETCDTCADGLATRTPEPESVNAIREVVDDIILLSEDELLNAIRQLHDGAQVLAEPAGAAATAAFLKSAASSAIPQSGPVVLLVTGANITPTIRQRAGLPLL